MKLETTRNDVPFDITEHWTSLGVRCILSILIAVCFFMVRWKYVGAKGKKKVISSTFRLMVSRKECGESGYHNGVEIKVMDMVLSL